MSGLPLLRLVLLCHVRVCLLVMVCGWLTQPEPAQAKGGSIPPVNLTAPEEVREVLAQHFTLPDTLLKNENERAIFMRRAQREIPELLVTEGFFSGKVVLRSVSHAGVLELEVIPGPRTVVTELNIEFRGDLALPEAQRSERVQQLRESWLLQTGTAFRTPAWDEAKANLLAQVARKDYAAARMAENLAQVDAAKAGARLHIVVDSGPRFRFGELQVSGLERYEEILVSRHAGFSRGQPYDRDLLLAFQNRLQNMPQFSSVIVNFDTLSGHGQATADTGEISAPVKVQVVEGQSRKIALGIGYSTNNGVRNEVNYQSYNFLNQAWTFSSAIVAEQNRQTVSAGLDTPPNPLGYRLSWKGSGEKTQIQGLQTQRDKFGVTRSRTQFGIESGIGLNWTQERRIPLGGIRETDQALVLDWHWYRRAVDDPLFPMAGQLTDVRLGGASKSLLSTQNFVRTYLRHQTWIPLGERDGVSLRIEAGYTAAVSRLGIPQEYLFRVGGTQTVRGFAYQSLGVREGNAVVGGRAMTTASVEYTHWFGGWGAALFTDAGGAADTAPGLRLSLGYGGGLRWRTPLGPLALDVARGKGQPDTRVHFSVAVAF
ncbi:MAG: BamA/TamA family outer membrane protein [Sideroxyarcus sp.]|nr:BamA/TamA family outer membrane protein [Sideroxyarcus sp.]